MTETTSDQLITAAARLLDDGGQEAVTLRAVGELVGVSHNAPYRHFNGRSSLLAAVARRDFIALRAAFEHHGDKCQVAETALGGAVTELISYALNHPARYRLLFSDPQLIPDDALKAVAFASFTSFACIVERCQQERCLPAGDSVELTGLIYATLHGAIDLEIGGRASDTKGLASVEATALRLFDLLKVAAVQASA